MSCSNCSTCQKIVDLIPRHTRHEYNQKIGTCEITGFPRGVCHYCHQVVLAVLVFSILYSKFSADSCALHDNCFILFSPNTTVLMCTQWPAKNKQTDLPVFCTITCTSLAWCGHSRAALTRTKPSESALVQLFHAPANKIANETKTKTSENGPEVQNLHICILTPTPMPMQSHPRPPPSTHTHTHAHFNHVFLFTHPCNVNAELHRGTRMWMTDVTTPMLILQTQCRSKYICTRVSLKPFHFDYSHQILNTCFQKQHQCDPDPLYFTSASFRDQY